MAKPAIALFSDAFYPQLNGVVTYLTNITNNLARKGYPVILVVPRYGNASLPPFHRNVRIIQVFGIKAGFYPDFKFTPPLQFKVYQELKKSNVKIVNFQTPFTLGAEAIWMAKMLDCPLIGTFHTFIATPEYMHHIPILGNFKQSEALAWAYLRGFYNRCDRVISVSKYTKGELEDHGIRSIEVINCCVDFTRFGTKPYRGIKIPKKSFVFVGRIEEEKNITRLILSFKEAIRVDNAIRLYLIGDGKRIENYKKFAKEKSLDHSVVFLGRMDNKIITETDLLGRFTAFVTMSNTENQPMTIIEAMHKRLPIIGAGVRGVTELIDGNGILVRKNDIKGMARAVLRLCKEESLRDRMAEASHDMSQQFDASIIAKNLERLYHSLIISKATIKG